MMPQRHKFVKALSTALRDRCDVRPGDRLLAAVSGGCDSVALLRALMIIAKRRTWRLKLAVGHVQHHLREQPGNSGGSGGDAEKDAAFVESLAQCFDLTFYRADLDLSSERGNTEAAARRGRYDALATLAGTFKASFVVTAHQGDDQLETLLMRLLRGTAVSGLGGMAWRRRLHAHRDTLLIRPMLAVDRAQAEQFLRDIDQPWREDHTNRDFSRLRARLRHEVLPMLRAIRPDVTGKTVALTDHLRAVSRVLKDAVELAADRVLWINGAATFDRTDARSLPAVVLVGLLRRLLTTAGAHADRLGSNTISPVTRAIRDTKGGERHFDISGNVQLEITRDTVRIIGRG